MEHDNTGPSKNDSNVKSLFEARKKEQPLNDDAATAMGEKGKVFDFSQRSQKEPQAEIPPEEDNIYYRSLTATAAEKIAAIAIEVGENILKKRNMKPDEHMMGVINLPSLLGGLAADALVVLSRLKLQSNVENANKTAEEIREIFIQEYSANNAEAASYFISVGHNNIIENTKMLFKDQKQED